MSTRFYVVINSPQVTGSQQNQITDRFLKRGWNVWHWIDSFWLVVSPEGNCSPKEVSKEIISVVGSQVFFIVGETTGGFQAAVPIDSGPWIMAHWDPVIKPD